MTPAEEDKRMELTSELLDKERMAEEYRKMSKQNREAAGWDMCRQFSFIKAVASCGSGIRPESDATIRSTYEMGKALEKAGLDVRYVYGPTFVWFDKNGETRFGTAKSRAIDSLEECVAYCQREYAGKTIFLYAFMEDIPEASLNEAGEVVRTGRTFCKIRYDIQENVE